MVTTEPTLIGRRRYETADDAVCMDALVLWTSGVEVAGWCQRREGRECVVLMAGARVGGRPDRECRDKWKTSAQKEKGEKRGKHTEFRGGRPY